MSRNQLQETVVVKGALDRSQVETERNALKRFQHRTAHLRPLFDEIEGLRHPTSIVLKYFDHDPSQAVRASEIMHVSRGILETLKVLYED